MKPGEWLAIAGLLLTVAAGAFTGWVQLETRITTLELEMRAQGVAEEVLRNEVLELIKKVHKIEGRTRKQKVPSPPVGLRPEIRLSGVKK